MCVREREREREKEREREIGKERGGECVGVFVELLCEIAQRAQCLGLYTCVRERDRTRV